jgi:hypothetical protein
MSGEFCDDRLGLGAELTHGRLISSMSPADKVLHRSLKQGANQHRREELELLDSRVTKGGDVSKGGGRKVKIQKKQQLEVKVACFWFLLMFPETTARR